MPSRPDPDARQTPKRRIAKRTAITLGMAVVLTLSVSEAMGWPFLRGPLETLLSERLDRLVSLQGPFRLRLVPAPRLEVGRLTVAHPAWADRTRGREAHMVEAVRLSLEVAWGEALSALRSGRWQEVRLTEVTVAALTLDLLRNPAGLANWQLGGPRDGETRPAAEPPSPTLPRIGELNVAAGRLQLLDEPMRLQLSAAVSTQEARLGDRTGGRGPAKGLVATAAGRYRGHPFKLTLSSSGVLPLLRHDAAAETVPIQLEARAGTSQLAFKGRSRDVLRLHALEGQVEVTGRSMGELGEVLDVALPTTAAFRLTGRLLKEADEWRLQRARLAVGDSRLGGHFRLQRRTGKPPLLSGLLTGPHLALRDLGPSIGVPVAGAPVPPPPAGKLLPAKPLDASALRALEAQVQVRLERLSLGAWFDQPLAPLHADLDLRDGVLSIRDLDTATAHGALRGKLQLDGRRDTLRWQGELRWRDIRLEHWLRAPNRFADRPEQGFLGGRLAGRASFAGQGNSVADLMASLDGQVLTWIEQGRLSRLLIEGVGLHFVEALGLWLTGDEHTALRCGVARLSIEDGVAQANPIVLDTGASTLLMSGQVGLAQESLRLSVTSTPHHPTLFSLRSPIDIGGTFSQPTWRIRRSALGLKASSAVLLALINPLAALLPLIDPGGAAVGCNELLDKGR